MDEFESFKAQAFNFDTDCVGNEEDSSGRRESVAKEDQVECRLTRARPSSLRFNKPKSTVDSLRDGVHHRRSQSCRRPRTSKPRDVHLDVHRTQGGRRVVKTVVTRTALGLSPKMLSKLSVLTTKYLSSG